LIPCFSSLGYVIILLLKNLKKPQDNKKTTFFFFSPGRIASFLIEVVFVLANVTLFVNIYFFVYSRIVPAHELQSDLFFRRLWGRGNRRGGWKSREQTGRRRGFYNYSFILKKKEHTKCKLANKLYLSTK